MQRGKEIHHESETWGLKKDSWKVYFPNLAGHVFSMMWLDGCSWLKRIYWRCSVKKGVFKNFANFTVKHMCWSFFLIKLRAFRNATLLKRDSNTIIFVWNFQNFLEHLFWRTSVNGRFCFKSTIVYAFMPLCLYILPWLLLMYLKTEKPSIWKVSRLTQFFFNFIDKILSPTGFLWRCCPFLVCRRFFVGTIIHRFHNSYFINEF